MSTAKDFLNYNARAALTESPSLELVKPSYGFIPTHSIVEKFLDHGWELQSARQARVKNVERDGYQRHLLRFRHPDIQRIDGLSNDNASIPELVLMNSHDGTSALRIYFGLMRLACLNGIILGSSVHSMRVIHSQNAIKHLDDSIDDMRKSIPDIVARVSRLANKTLSEEKRIELARSAVDIRLKNTSGDISVPDNLIRAAMRPRRIADVGLDAYSVFNVIQERVIRGGIQYYKTDPKTGAREHRTTRAIQSVNQSVRINRELWDAVEKIANDGMIGTHIRVAHE